MLVYGATSGLWLELTQHSTTKRVHLNIENQKIEQFIFCTFVFCNATEQYLKIYNIYIQILVYSC